MLQPERGARRDAFLGHEDLAVLVPRPDTLGRAADRLDDRRLDAGQRENRAHRLALEPVLLVDALDEGAHVVPLGVQRAREGRRAGGDLAEGEHGAAEDEVGGFHLASRLR
jgi:hypothetical protein